MVEVAPNGDDKQTEPTKIGEILENPDEVVAAEGDQERRKQVERADAADEAAAAADKRREAIEAQAEGQDIPDETVEQLTQEALEARADQHDQEQS